MREIKFRAWNKEQKRMLEVDSICFSLNKVMCNYSEYNTFVWESCDNFELMQFTGLVDENKKDVYEGDILKKDNKIYKVIWGISEPAFIAITKEKHCNVYSVSGLLNHGALVIGNIYENPELLEDKND